MSPLRRSGPAAYPEATRHHRRETLSIPLTAISTPRLRASAASHAGRQSKHTQTSVLQRQLIQCDPGAQILSVNDHDDFDLAQCLSQSTAALPGAKSSGRHEWGSRQKQQSLLKLLQAQGRARGIERKGSIACDLARQAAVFPRAESCLRVVVHVNTYPSCRFSRGAALTEVWRPSRNTPLWAGSRHRRQRPHG